MGFVDLIRSLCKQNASPVHIYDPRQANVFRFGPLPNGNWVPAEKHVVIHCFPQFDIPNSEKSRLLSTAVNFLETEQGRGFLYASGVPKSLENAILELDQSNRIGDDAVLGYFEAAPSSFSYRSRLLTGMPHGAIMLGNINSAVPVPRHDHEILEWKKLRNGYRIDYFMAMHLEKINWYLSFDTDNAETVVLAQIDSRIDAFLEELNALLGIVK